MFGKLPAKRDFIAVNTPREFLTAWEQWMQGGVAASKIALGTGWLPAFLSAPLWRFWLGAGLTGMPVAGAFMPSVDGVGRHFPLTVFDCGDAKDQFLPPADQANANWYDTLETYLLSALEPESDYSTLLAALDLLPLAGRIPASEPNPDFIAFFSARIGRAADVAAIGETFLALEAERDRVRLDRTSFWWTIGGEGFEPAAIVADGLPDPHILTSMLTGRFEARAT
jgi:type VI secretion system protein ImpM